MLQRKCRSGCGTCKARKVKCDETKPVCSRCRSTGRTCDGYGILGGGGNTYLERYGRSASCPSHSNSNSNSNTLRPLPTYLFSHTQELRYLELYKQRVLWTSSGWFAVDFWHAIVLPALMSEPAVLHAVIALSAAHPCNFDPDQTSDARDRFTVKQYSKAICALQPLLRYGDRASVMVVLVTCQVFTFLEFIRGRYRSAETHLRNGVRLLRDMSCNDGGKVTSALDKGIVKSFKALITQTSLFGIAFDDTELFLYPLQASGVSSGEAFSSSEEAKDALDAILRHIMLLSQRAEKDNATSSKQQYDERCSAQKHISAVLESWHNNYLRIMTPKFNKDAPTCPESALASSLPFGTHIPQSASPTYTRTHLSYHLLLMYHTMARLLNLSLSPDFCQTRYKAYTGLFLAILTHAHTIFTAYRLAQSIPGNVNLDDSVSESGFIAPLYYTGIKCRVGRVRRFAQRLLRVVPHKEGMWDAFVAANVVGRVMQLEEPSVCSKGEDEQHVSLLEVPVLSVQDEEGVIVEALFRSVSVQMCGDGGIAAHVTCVRERSGEVAVFMVDNT